MDFCRARIEMPPGLAANHGVLSAPALALTTDARLAAERLVTAARAQAAALVGDELLRCRADIDARQQEALCQAQAMLAGLERLPREFLARTEPVVIELAQALFMRLVGKLAPAERARALLHQLQAETPLRLPEPVLYAHPDDPVLDATHAPELPSGWRARADAALPPGRYRLASAAGEWQVDFDAAALALVRSLEAQGGAVPAPA